MARTYWRKAPPAVLVIVLANALLTASCPTNDVLTAVNRLTAPDARKVVGTDGGDAQSSAAAMDAGASQVVPNQDRLELPARVSRVVETTA